jgi:hypothetical protein
MNRKDVEKLIGGYATGSLTAQEQAVLLEQALEDQHLFNALMEEQALKDLLDSPGVRQTLVEVLESPRRIWFQRPLVWAMAGSFAALLAAIILIRPSVQEYRSSLSSSKTMRESTNNALPEPHRSAALKSASPEQKSREERNPVLAFAPPEQKSLPEPKPALAPAPLDLYIRQVPNPARGQTQREQKSLPEPKPALASAPPFLPTNPAASAVMALVKPEQAKEEILTNDSVIQLLKAGLDENSIIAKIQDTKYNFDMSTPDLVALKQAGASSRLIQFMMDPANEPPRVTPSPPAGGASQPGGAPTSVAAAANYPSEIGVYIKKDGQWVEAQPEVVNWKTGGVTHLATAGIVKGDVNGNINGAHSRNAVKASLEFIIVAPEGVSITEYQLIKLHEQKDYREFRTITGGVMHAQAGTTRDLLEFEGTKVASRTFSVNLPSLGAGEYGLLPPGAIASGHSSGSIGKMYTFSISSGDVATPSSATSTVEVYQAEDATLSGSAKINREHRGFAGTGYVDGYGGNGVGATTTFSVSIQSPGEYLATLRYANATLKEMTLSIYLDGVKVKQITLPSMNTWDDWSDASTVLNFTTAGQHHVAYRYDPGDSGNVNLDLIRISPYTPKKF